MNNNNTQKPIKMISITDLFIYITSVILVTWIIYGALWAIIVRNNNDFDNFETNTFGFIGIFILTGLLLIFAGLTIISALLGL